MNDDNPFSGTCPHCEGPFMFPKEGIGKLVLCPHCRKEIILREGEASSPTYDRTFWLWLNEKEDGPHTFQDLQSKLHNEEINEHTLFAEQNSPTWGPLSAIIKQLSFFDVPVVEIPESKPEPVVPEKPTHKNCPYCAEQILFEAIKCKHCGSLLETIPKPLPSTDKGLSGLGTLGTLLLIGGLAVAGYFFLVFDASVESDTGRVNNLGLMADRENGIIIGIGLAVIGAMMLVIDSRGNN